MECSIDFSSIRRTLPHHHELGSNQQKVKIQFKKKVINISTRFGRALFVQCFCVQCVCVSASVASPAWCTFDHHSFLPMFVCLRVFVLDGWKCACCCVTVFGFPED